MKTKYALHPGLIRSITDGDEHFITAQQLQRLYDLAPEDFIVWQGGRLHGVAWSAYTHLYPRLRYEDYTATAEQIRKDRQP